MKWVTVIGARPQFIKAGPVSRLVREEGSLHEILVHTGQHYNPEMSDVFFEELKLPKPDHHLGIGSGPHGQQTGKMLEALEQVLLSERPDGVLVYGDTNSTLAGALAAVKLHIPVAHVEAGLRSFNMRMPEEVNRIVTDRLSDVLFAPTDTAVENLKQEGIAEDRVRRVGDVMLDASLLYARESDTASGILASLGLTPGEYYLATLHRAENTDDRDKLLIRLNALVELSKKRPVVLPLHPRTRVAIEREGWENPSATLRLIEPVGYLDMVQLEKHAAVILTDSGGVQKEAFFYKVPCVTLREETEWVELVQHGFNRLAHQSSEDIVRAAQVMEQNSLDWGLPLYGDGTAARAIVSALTEVA